MNNAQNILDSRAMSGFPKENQIKRYYNSLDQESFVGKAMKVHDDTYDYSKTVYLRSSIKITITCKRHGDFEQTPNAHLRGAGCKKCYMERVGSTLVLTDEVFQERSNLKHDFKYYYLESGYVNNVTKVEIVCPKHGMFMQSPADHLAGKGCRKCAAEAMANKFSHSLEMFTEKAVQVHKDLYGYSNVVYRNVHTKVLITCRKHGDFLQTPAKHLSGRGCPICKASKGEIIIFNILKKHMINFVTEYRLDKNYRFLYDFYLPEKGILIEFHGIQHYKPVEYFGGEIGLCGTKTRDKLKKHLVKVHKKKLVELNYKHLKRMTDYEFEVFFLKSIGFWR